MTTRGSANSGPAPRDPASDGLAPSPRVTDDLVDAFFDRELDPRRSRDLLCDLKDDVTRSEEIARTQRMLSLLRRTPIHGERAEEERVDAIMARVDRRRRFLPDAWRRFVTAGRLATAATFLLAGLGVAVLGRTHPNALRLAPQPAPIAMLVDMSRTEAAESAARCCVTLETLSDQAAAPLMHILASSKGQQTAQGGATFADPLHPGPLATVRFTDYDTDLRLMRGSGELVLGPIAASATLGLEWAASRQRSGASAPVFVPTLRGARTPGSIEVRSVSAVFSSVSSPVGCQSVTVGDHTVFVPLTLDPEGWIGGPDAARSLLLIQASPSDLFPLR